MADLPTTETQARLGDAVAHACDNPDQLPLRLTRDGDLVAVLISPADYQLLTTLRDPHHRGVPVPAP